MPIPRIDRRRFVRECALLCLMTEARPAFGRRPIHRIYLQPLGWSLPPAELGMVKAALTAFYEIDLVVQAPLELPRWTYYPPRRRYRAERLLELLQSRAPPDAHRVLGVTSVDISTTKGKHRDWGVLGLASVDGTACVLSSFRCKRKSNGMEHAAQRFGKVAVHELGHTFGLLHCREAKTCLMQDARGSVLTTDREYDLCPACRQKLTSRRYALSSGEVPWPRP